jgi:flagellar biosynthesis/type III secretory pathway chaperone
MIEPLMIAAERLAEALRAENAALALLDLAAAAELATTKREAAEAFASAYAAAHLAGSRAEGEARERAEEIALHLRDLTAENRRLLERAIELQSRVIETIAGALRPTGPGTYGARGRVHKGDAGPVSVAARI